MVDQIRTLLLNPSGVRGYLHVDDSASDNTLLLFGIDGQGSEGTVDALMPLVLSPDLHMFRGVFDDRVSPAAVGSVYRSDYGEIPAFDQLYARVFSPSGWWTVSSLFVHSDPHVNQQLAQLREAAVSGDSAFALGAILLTCAYRRLLLQEEVL